MKNYKVIVSSAMVALFITGCSANEKEGANENLGLNRTNQNDYNTTNVSDRNERYPVGYPNQYTNNQNPIRVAESVANRIEDLREVKRAKVIVTDNRAYVGAVLQKGEDSLTSEVKDKIANAVRNADSSINEVHVSTNPDFIKKMNQYVNDAENGKPVEGFTDEFQNLVNRVFPSSR